MTYNRPYDWFVMPVAVLLMAVSLSCYEARLSAGGVQKIPLSYCRHRYVNVLVNVR